MYHFFVERSQIDIENKTAYITGSDYNHAKNVLRLSPGEEISLSDGESDNEYRVSVKGYTEDRVDCDLLFVKESDVELPIKITLMQALAKGDKMETVVQKAVELGAYSIMPVKTERCVVKWDDKKADSKIKRLNTIAEAAAKQSQRGVIPEVTKALTFKEAIDAVKDHDIKLMPYEMAEGMEKTREILSKINVGMSVAVLIGPEGGFAESEVEYAAENGFEIITLGKRILRTETAGMTVLSILSYLTEK